MTASPRRQHGAALLAMLLVLVLGGAWYLVSRLNAAGANQTASIRNQNAVVLAQAKQALLGYVAYQAALAGEVNPGAFPCPETPSGMTSTTGFDGRTQTPSCALPAVGRFPWRTIGTDKLADSAGEPLWYVVAAGWSKPGPLGADYTLINSNCTSDVTMACNTGLLTVDGVKDTVALIISPGPAFSVPAAGGCIAWNQMRTITAAPDFRDYLECENATSPADATFVTTGPSGSFNDQVVKITAAEVLPLIEAAIADRFQREIAVDLRKVYSDPVSGWGGTTTLPFALSFSNPAAAASYAPGVTHNTQGILPLSYSETAPTSGAACTADPRCQPLFVAWTSGTLSGASINSPSCTVVTGTTTRLDCTFYYTCDLITCAPPTLNYTIQAQAANVGASLRKINLSAPIGSANVTATLTGATGALDAAGAATLTLTGTATPDGSGGFLGALLGNLFCGLPLIGPILGCKQSLISVPIGVLADHPLVDVNNTTYGWFLRNKWHEVSYYAVAPGIAPGGGGSCTDSTTCLRVTYHASDGKQRGLILIAGRALGSQARPPAAVSDLLEGANADGASPFETRSATLPINRGFNDRIAVIDSNP